MTIVTSRRQPSTTGLGAGLAASILLVGLIAGAIAAYAGVARFAPRDVQISALDIFLNNLKVLGALAAGVASAGVASLLLLLQNGLYFGCAIGGVLMSGHYAAVLTGVVPHLLPELGGFVVAAGADIVLGFSLAKRLVRGERLLRPGELRRWAGQQAAAVLLLGVGAVVEAGVSHV